MRFHCLIVCALGGLAQTLSNHATAGEWGTCREGALAPGSTLELAPRSPGLSPDQRGDAKRPGNTRRVTIAISGMT